MNDKLCETCGVGYYLPSGVCDHCDTARPGSEIAALRADKDALDWLSANHETFLASKFYIVAKFDGLRAGIAAARR